MAQLDQAATERKREGSREPIASAVFEYMQADAFLGHRFCHIYGPRQNAFPITRDNLSAYLKTHYHGDRSHMRDRPRLARRPHLQYQKCPPRPHRPWALKPTPLGFKFALGTISSPLQHHLRQGAEAPPKLILEWQKPVSSLFSRIVTRGIGTNYYANRMALVGTGGVDHTPSTPTASAHNLSVPKPTASSTSLASKSVRDASSHLQHRRRRRRRQL